LSPVGYRLTAATPRRLFYYFPRPVDHPAVAQYDGALRLGCDVGVVRYDDDGFSFVVYVLKYR
jgi:hypothetical protein